ncbi:MobA/MobL family protein [Glacieibacterium frigidum]|uniref:MobA/MobL protein domain-containing protein n=1 Tax=Glacieibacterium frigidum TaxID=2593303 RepID=A0A552UHN0_9SPHN|nr:MobA/MobL family protein [Glacieibacterium frigidum]TRW17732.1 hypothetical protein FMM06_06240 [Glacieibacterium frigidum]
MSRRPFVFLAVAGQAVPTSGHRLSDPAAISTALRESAYLRRTRYIAKDNRLLFDFTLRSADLVAIKVIAPVNAPTWTLSPYLVWTLADGIAAGRAAPENICAWQIVADLPATLSAGKWLDGAVDIIRSAFKTSDAIIELAIHAPPGRTAHAHLLVTARRLSKDGFGAIDAARLDLIAGPLKNKWLRWLRRYRATSAG